MNFRSRRAALPLAVAIATCCVSVTHAGFLQTGAGPFDYNDAANWTDLTGDLIGEINGVWDAALTITAGQTVTFGADTTLTTGLDFSYTGSQT